MSRQCLVWRIDPNDGLLEAFHGGELEPWDMPTERRWIGGVKTAAESRAENSRLYSYGLWRGWKRH